MTFLLCRQLELYVQLGRIWTSLGVNVGPRRLLLELAQRISMHIENRINMLGHTECRRVRFADDSMETYWTEDLPNDNVLKSAMYIENVSSNRGPYRNYDFRASRFKELYIEQYLCLNVGVRCRLRKIDIKRYNRCCSSLSKCVYMYIIDRSLWFGSERLTVRMYVCVVCTAWWPEPSLWLASTLSP